MINTKAWIVALPALVYLLSGCASQPTFRASTGFAERSQAIWTVVLLPGKIKVYQIDAGGVREEIEAWSAQAKENVVTALRNELRTHMNARVEIADENTLAEEKVRLEETQGLYTAVAATILLHTYPNPNFPSHYFEDKRKNFDYSLGSEVAGFAKDAEALLLLDAQDHVWTGGRQALQALGVILGVGAGVATGVVIIPQLGGGTAVRAALVDARTGDILWFNAVQSGAGTDLRDSASATQMVGVLFKDFGNSGGHGAAAVR